jgi:hypothetical protein
MVEILMLKLFLPEIWAFSRGKKIPQKLTMPTTKLRLGKGARGSDSIADAMQDTFFVLNVLWSIWWRRNSYGSKD